MTKPVKFHEMLVSLPCSLEAIPEHRTDRTVQYGLADAGLGAYAAFFLQSPSSLAYQQKMRQHHGRGNAKSLLGMEETPAMGRSATAPTPLLRSPKPSRPLPLTPQSWCRCGLGPSRQTVGARTQFTRGPQARCPSACQARDCDRDSNSLGGTL